MNKQEVVGTQQKRTNGGKRLPTVGFSLTALFKDDSNVLIAFMTKDISAMRVLWGIKRAIHN